MESDTFRYKNIPIATRHAKNIHYVPFNVFFKKKGPV